MCHSQLLHEYALNGNVFVILFFVGIGSSVAMALSGLPFLDYDSMELTLLYRDLSCVDSRMDMCFHVMSAESSTELIVRKYKA